MGSNPTLDYGRRAASIETSDWTKTTDGGLHPIAKGCRTMQCSSSVETSTTSRKKPVKVEHIADQKCGRDVRFRAASMSVQA